MQPDGPVLLEEVPDRPALVGGEVVGEERDELGRGVPYGRLAKDLAGPGVDRGGVRAPIGFTRRSAADGK